MKLPSRFMPPRSSSQTKLLMEDDTYEYYEEVITDDEEDDDAKYVIEEIMEEQTVSSSELENDEDHPHNRPNKIMPIRLSQRMTMFDAPDLETLDEASVETETRSQRSGSSRFRRKETVPARKEKLPLRGVTISCLASLQEEITAIGLSPTDVVEERNINQEQKQEQSSNQSTHEETSQRSLRRPSTKKTLTSSPRQFSSSSSRPPKPGKSRSSSDIPSPSKTPHPSLPRRSRSETVKSSIKAQLSDNPPPPMPPSAQSPHSRHPTTSNAPLIRPSPLPPKRKEPTDQSQSSTTTTLPRRNSSTRKHTSKDEGDQVLKEGVLLTAGLNDTTDSQHIELVDTQKCTSTPVTIMETTSTETKTRKRASQILSGSDKSLKSAHSEDTGSTVATTPPASPAPIQPSRSPSSVLRSNSGSSSSTTPRRSSYARRGSIEHAMVDATATSSRRGSNNSSATSNCAGESSATRRGSSTPRRSSIGRTSSTDDHHQLEPPSSSSSNTPRQSAIGRTSSTGDHHQLELPTLSKSISSPSKSPQTAAALERRGSSQRRQRRSSQHESPLTAAAASDEIWDITQSPSSNSLVSRLDKLSDDDTSPSQPNVDMDGRSLNSSRSSRKSRSDRRSSHSRITPSTGGINGDGNSNITTDDDEINVSTSSLTNDGSDADILTTPSRRREGLRRMKSETHVSARRDSSASAIKAATVRRQQRERDGRPNYERQGSTYSANSHSRTSSLDSFDEALDQYLEVFEAMQEQDQEKEIYQTTPHDEEHPHNDQKYAKREEQQRRCSFKDDKNEEGRTDKSKTSTKDERYGVDKSPPKPDRKLSLDDLLARLPEEARGGNRDARSTASGLMRRRKNSSKQENEDDQEDANDCHSLIEGKFSRQAGRKRPTSSKPPTKERSKSMPSRKGMSDQRKEGKKKKRSSSLKREKKSKSTNKSPSEERPKYTWWNLGASDARPYLVADTDHSNESYGQDPSAFHDSMSTGFRHLVDVTVTETPVKKEMKVATAAQNASPTNLSCPTSNGSSSDSKNSQSPTQRHRNTKQATPKRSRSMTTSTSQSKSSSKQSNPPTRCAPIPRRSKSGRASISPTVSFGSAGSPSSRSNTTSSGNRSGSTVVVRRGESVSGGGGSRTTTTPSAVLCSEGTSSSAHEVYGVSKPPLSSPSPRKELSSSTSTNNNSNNNGTTTAATTRLIPMTTTMSPSSMHALPAAKDRLLELESIKEFLTAEEYESKRQEILSCI